MSRRARSGDGTVGYGRPPAHAQFQPGQSGNPRGRPKGAKNFAARFHAALDERVNVTENGKRRKLPKSDVIIKQIVNKAAEGDIRSLALLFKAMASFPPTQDQAVAEPVLGNAEDERIFAEHVRKYSKIAGDGDLA